MASDATIQQSIDGAGLGGRDAAIAPAIAWAIIAVAIWFVSWLARVRIRRHSDSLGERPTWNQRLGSWIPFAFGVPFFLAALYFFFENFARFLPANY